MKHNEQLFAEHLLKRRELGGRRPPFSMRQKIGYSVWGALLVIAVLLENISPHGPVAAFLFGVCIASVGREIAWYKTMRMTWPFTEKVIDWAKVQESSKSQSEQAAASDGDSAPV